MAIRVLNSLLIVACLIVAIALFRQQPPHVLVTAAAAVPVGHDEPSLEPDAAELAMRTRLPAITLPNTTLAGALQELSKAAGFRIEIREDREAVGGIRADLDVASDTTLREALYDLFEQINPKIHFPFERLGAKAIEDRIIIARHDVLDVQTMTVVYNVRDLLDADAQNPKNDDAQADGHTPAERLIALTRAIQDTDPISIGIYPWQRDFMGLLVVSGSRRQHAKIAELLQNLREASRERAPSSRIVKESDIVQ